MLLGIIECSTRINRAQYDVARARKTVLQFASLFAKVGLFIAESNQTPL